MINRLDPQDAMAYQVERQRDFLDLLESKGTFGLQQFRKDSSGNYQLIGVMPFSNGVTDVGKLAMLERMFNGGTQTSNWYLGLIDGSSNSPILSNLDTAASHTGWTEFVNYSEVTRQVWTKGSASANSLTGTSASLYTIGNVPANSFVAGGFVIDNNTKGGTTGLLWSAGLYPNPVAIQATDIFKLAYITGL